MPICHYATNFGTDPEIFFSKDGKIVGSERVIPPDGLGATLGKVALDGVQAELHPNANTHIPALGNNLRHCFLSLDTRLKALNSVFTINFAQVVQVEKEELDTLSEKSRLLGCLPSFNFYGRKPFRPKADFPTRSLAGHMHLGLSAPIYKGSGDNRQGLIPLLDILTGNTLTILDRDPLAAERRKMYGRAGEFRLPKHGLEYRTPSNFWLKAYPIMELAFGLASTAVDILATSLSYPQENPEADIAKVIDLRKVEKAINTNNAGLALENWDTIKGFFTKHVTQLNSFSLFKYPVHAGNLERFDKFLRIAAEGGLESHLPADPVQHWLTFDPSIHSWENLLNQVVP